MDCVFCKIVNGDIPSSKIYEDDIVIAFLDINPDSLGHTLIIPKHHYRDLDDIDDKTLIYIVNIAKMLKKIEGIKCQSRTNRQYFHYSYARGSHQWIKSIFKKVSSNNLSKWENESRVRTATNLLKISSFRKEPSDRWPFYSSF